MKHTATPWIQDKRLPAYVCDFEGQIIAHATRPCHDMSERESPQRYLDAAHIVRCVNAHDELVKALESAETFISDWLKVNGERNFPRDVSLRDNVRAALAKANS